RLAYRVAVLGQSPKEAGRQDRLSADQTRTSLRQAIEVLAGETRAPHPSPRSRPVIHARIKEIPLMQRSDSDTQEESGPSVMPLLVTVNQAAQLLGIGRST